MTAEALVSEIDALRGQIASLESQWRKVELPKHKYLKVIEYSDLEDGMIVYYWEDGRCKGFNVVSRFWKFNSPSDCYRALFGFCTDDGCCHQIWADTKCWRVRK